MTVRRWLWVSCGAGLAAFLSVAVGLSMAAGGPGPGLAASAAPTTPDRTTRPSVNPCDQAKACAAIAIVTPGIRSSDYPDPSARARSAAILAALSAIDWCAYPNHQPCPGGSTAVTAADVAIVRDTLRRAGFSGATVEFQAGIVIRYSVPVGPACVTGYLVNTQVAPFAHSIYPAEASGC